MAPLLRYEVAYRGLLYTFKCAAILGDLTLHNIPWIVHWSLRHGCSEERRAPLTRMVAVQVQKEKGRGCGVPCRRHKTLVDRSSGFHYDQKRVDFHILLIFYDKRNPSGEKFQIRLFRLLTESEDPPGV